MFEFFYNLLKNFKSNILTLNDSRKCCVKKKVGEMEEEFERIDEENSWSALYQYIRSKAKEHVLPHKEARKAANIHLNRYKDVYPYDHSRICLHRADTNYINASLVPVPKAQRSYILTQGPLPTTTSHFWAMVWEQKSKAIVMLNRIIEKNIIKCHKYWPSTSENELILEDVNLKVTNQGEEMSVNYVIRHLMLTDLKIGESRLIYHFHYVTWPDFGVPETPEEFLHFLHIVKEKGVLDDISNPPVVHCSAGIGRSGTFCLVDSSLVMTKEGKNLDINSIKDLLLEMRRYRMGLIQTADQLRFSYLAIIEGAKSILNETVQPLLPQKQKMTEVFQDNLKPESSSEDTESESSETTSEESVISNADEIAFGNQMEPTSHNDNEIQDCIEISSDETVDNESSYENGSHLDEESSDMTEIELKNDENLVDDTKIDKVHADYNNFQDTETCSVCKDSVEQYNSKPHCKDTSKLASKEFTHPQETFDLSRKCTAHDLNTIEEANEAVKAIEALDGIETVNETLRENQRVLSNSVHFHNEVNPALNVHTDNTMQSIAEHVQNLTEPSETSKASLDESLEINASQLCDDGKQCLASNIYSPDKLANQYTNLACNSEKIYNDDDVCVGMMSRHLECYENGDVFSAKEYKHNLSEKNAQSQNDRNIIHQNFNNSKNFASQYNFRSSSCPRQLPSISSKLQQSRIDGDARKRRNSTESGHLLEEDDTAPLKFQKMHKDHRNAESQIVEEFAFVEDTYEATCQDRPKESALRSKR